MGNGRLRHVQRFGQIADADLCFQKDKEDPDAGRVSEDLEQFGKIKQIILRRKLLVYKL